MVTCQSRSLVNDLGRDHCDMLKTESVSVYETSSFRMEHKSCRSRSQFHAMQAHKHTVC